MPPPPAESAEPAQFNVELEIPVRWGDMDALGHVNNTVYFVYFESARIAYFDRIGAFSKYDGEGLGPILASTHCNFLRPVAYPATLLCGVRVSRIGHSSFAMDYRIRDKATGVEVATGSCVNVMFDYRAQKKVAVPAFIREAIRSLDGVE